MPASLRAKVQRFFEGHPTEWSIQDIAERLGCSEQAARRHTLAMYEEGLLMRTGVWQRRHMYMIKD